MGTPPACSDDPGGPGFKNGESCTEFFEDPDHQSILAKLCDGSWVNSNKYSLGTSSMFLGPTLRYARPLVTLRASITGGLAKPEHAHICTGQTVLRVRLVRSRDTVVVRIECCALRF